MSKISFDYIDLGGGFGIQYKNKDKKIDIKKYSIWFKNFKKRQTVKLYLSQEDTLLAIQDSLFAKIIFIKKNGNKYFVIFDAGMNDFMRPALYNAKHEIVSVSKSKKELMGILNLLDQFVKVPTLFLKI